MVSGILFDDLKSVVDRLQSVTEVSAQMAAFLLASAGGRLDRWTLARRIGSADLMAIDRYGRSMTGSTEYVLDGCQMCQTYLTPKRALELIDGSADHADWRKWIAEMDGETVRLADDAPTAEDILSDLPKHLDLTSEADRDILNLVKDIPGPSGQCYEEAA